MKLLSNHIQKYILLFLYFSHLSFSLESGMGQGFAFTTQDFLLEDVLITDQNIQSKNVQDYTIVGGFSQGVVALVYTSALKQPLVLFTRSGNIVSQNPPNSLSSFINIDGLCACKINDNQLVVIYAGSNDATVYYIYASIINLQGDVIVKDILISDQSTNSKRPTCLNTENNDLYIIAWQAYGIDTNDSYGIYAINVSIINGNQINLIGSQFQINRTVQGDQLQPSLSLLSYSDNSNTNPKFIVISWQGPGEEFYNINTQQYEITSVETKNDINNDKCYFKFLRFQSGKYIANSIEYSFIDNHITVNVSKNVKASLKSNQILNIYANTYIVAEQKNQISTYEISLDFTDPDNVIATQYPNICTTLTQQPAQILQYKDINFYNVQIAGYYNLNFVIPINFSQETCLPYKGWQQTSQFKTDYFSPIAITESSGKVFGVMTVSKDNKIYYSEFYLEEISPCTGLDYCDLCYTDKNSNLQCSVCKGTNPYWRDIRIVNQTCPCKTEFINDPAKLDCVPDCAPFCDGCTLSPIDCTVCIDSPNRSSTLPCNCNDTYYSDTNYDCVQCVSPCLNCISETKCTSCLYESLIIDSITQQCVCQDGFYFDGLQNCLQCRLTCQTCDNNTQCTTCKTNATLSNEGFCKCDERYYQNSFYECEQCSQFCLQCDARGCYKCEQNRSILNDCQCSDGFEEDSNHQCVAIPNSEIINNQNRSCDTLFCLLCENNICQACVQSTPQRQLDANCSCPQGYVNGSGSDIKSCINDDLDNNNNQLDPKKENNSYFESKNNKLITTMLIIIMIFLLIILLILVIIYIRNKYVQYKEQQELELKQQKKKLKRQDSLSGKSKMDNDEQVIDLEKSNNNLNNMITQQFSQLLTQTTQKNLITNGNDVSNNKTFQNDIENNIDILEMQQSELLKSSNKLLNQNEEQIQTQKNTVRPEKNLDKNKEINLFDQIEQTQKTDLKNSSIKKSITKQRTLKKKATQKFDLDKDDNNKQELQKVENQDQENKQQNQDIKGNQENDEQQEKDDNKKIDKDQNNEKDKDESQNQQQNKEDKKNNSETTKSEDTNDTPKEKDKNQKQSKKRSKKGNKNDKEDQDQEQKENEQVNAQIQEEKQQEEDNQEDQQVNHKKTSEKNQENKEDKEILETKENQQEQNNNNEDNESDDQKEDQQQNKDSETQKKKPLKGTAKKKKRKSTIKK